MYKYKYIEGGVCAAKGFKAGGIHVGVKTKDKNKKDLALIISDVKCTAAAVYTKNIVKAAPLHVTMKHLENGRARAIVVNSGNANACAPNGEENALRTTKAAVAALAAADAVTLAAADAVTLAAADAVTLAAADAVTLAAADAVTLAEEATLQPDDVIVASTGVIGQTLPIEVIEGGLPAVVAALTDKPEGSRAAADAIMTTDTVRKEAAVEFAIGGRTLYIGGIAKGSGMIHPNMGTMLAFLTTDCAISSEMIKRAITHAAKISFNRISVDGDTSTNDMFTLMANGLGGNDEITAPGEAYDIFCEALTAVCTQLAKMMAADGEGATHLITCTVKGATDEFDAEKISKAVISSTLVKAAMFGADANWGRIICAMGYSGASFNPDCVNIAFSSKAGSIEVCRSGRGLSFDEDAAKKILTEHEIVIEIEITGGGESQCTCRGCDITYDYIKINGDYRT